MNTRILLTVCLLFQTILVGAQNTNDFIKGADVGFLIGQERRGQKFHDVNGNERECPGPTQSMINASLFCI